MKRGKAINRTPPTTISHTSCQDHSGPTAATTCRFSALVLATMQCNAPTPKFRPSSSKYAVSVNARITYQISIMCSLRAVKNLPAYKIEKHHAQEEIQTAKTQ